MLNSTRTSQVTLEAPSSLYRADIEVVQPEEDPFPEDPEEEVVDPFPKNPEEDCNTQLGTCQTQNTDYLTEKAALQHEKAA
ncbi:uncharacterized protein N7473_004252 [Penicillium subrubescens]|uniref:uncharacterized protein n=1 Tax=Penicillium subrubescens TaxID=1316194 RepID=UPI002544FAD5|nr:uncharacterized protein N7473_004252 [Penicillium subrubescens]KAJ5900182.1 hypothetical protein N7473_004252 [Penicillium subrubescens]